VPFSVDLTSIKKESNLWINIEKNQPKERANEKDILNDNINSFCLYLLCRLMPLH